MNEKYTIWAIATYKIIANIIRISLGILLFVVGLNLSRIKNFLVERSLAGNHNHLIFIYLIKHLNVPSFLATLILATTLIAFSAADIIFIIGILKRKFWAAVGFFIISLLWLPIELLFISRFLLIPKTLAIVIDLLILIFFFKVITSHDRYFKNK